MVGPNRPFPIYVLLRGVLAIPIYASEAILAYTIPGEGLAAELRALRRWDRCSPGRIHGGVF
jgi:hypothetical protein